MAAAALKISIVVLAVVCGMTLINNLHIMEPHKAPTIKALNVSDADGITKLGANESTDDAISDKLFGATSFLAYMGMIKDIIYMALLPGLYMTENGANIYVAGLVQALDTLAVILLLIQIVMKYGLGDSNV